MFARRRIINLKTTQKGISNAEVMRRLKREDKISCTSASISRIWKRFQATGLEIPGYGGGRRPILKVRHLDFIDDQLKKNTELTADDLRQKLLEEFGLRLSRPTVQRARKRLGWTYTGI